MAEEIGGLCDEALARYKKGDVPGAKTKVEAAYFEVFENLEGPIRVNVSAKVNYGLEEEFTAIRKMVLRKEPAAAVESRAAAFMTRLRGVVKELDGGVELVAEPSAAAQDASSLATEPGRTQPAWLEAVEGIEAGLGAALASYKKGEGAKAAALVEQTEFEHYRNSLLETAIRNELSQRRNFEHASRFSDIAGMLRSGEAAAKVEAEAGSLVSELRKDLPGLPLVPGAAARADGARTAGGEEDTARQRAKAVEDLRGALDEAAALYARGEAGRAVEAVQDAYFDVFEASGLEAAIGARDAGDRKSVV
jgi:high-affinity iron transporter